jgi:CubicO group peptidase (beta-lactamase class C family)
MRLFALLLLFIATGLQASPLSTRLDKIRAKHQVAGILAARIGKGEIVDLAASGCAYYGVRGTCERKLTPDHFVRVASISKLVAALGVMALVEQGKINLDADASKYLGFPFRNPAFPKKIITVRMLLAHTSSLRDNEVYWVEHAGKLVDLLDDENRFDAAHPPGGYFTYTNLNYGVLGQIIERVSGKRFDRFMQSDVFAPLGVSAGYNWSGLEKLPGRQVGVLYRKKQDDSDWNPDGPWIEQIDDFEGKSPRQKGRGYEGDPADYKIGTNGTLFSPQGGLRISLRNLAIITQALATNKSPVFQDMVKPVWRYARKGTVETGDTQGDFFKAYASGPQLYKGGKQAFPVAMPSHFADAYGLRGGLFFNPSTGDGWIYLITGFSREPMQGPKPAGCAYPGLAPAESDTLCAVWRGR